MTATYVGPIPPANVVKGWEEICPGAAERILEMAESDLAARQELQRSVLGANERDAILERNERRRGQILGCFTCSLAIVVGGLVAILTGEPAGQIAGPAMGAAGLTGLVVAFITGRRQESSREPQKQDSA